LEELRRESAEKQATLQEEINRLKREKEEVSNKKFSFPIMLEMN